MNWPSISLPSCLFLFRFLPLLVSSVMSTTSPTPLSPLDVSSPSFNPSNRSNQNLKYQISPSRMVRTSAFILLISATLIFSSLNFVKASPTTYDTSLDNPLLEKRLNGSCLLCDIGVSCHISHWTSHSKRLGKVWLAFCHPKLWFDFDLNPSSLHLMIPLSSIRITLSNNCKGWNRISRHC